MPLDFETLTTSKNGFSGSIIFVVGKSPMDLMEPILL